MSATADFEIQLRSWARDEAVMRRIRATVFTHEQGISEALDIDGLDGECTHALACAADGTAIGTARMLPDAHIGRIAVLREWRGRGVGTALTQALVDEAARLGHPRVFLNAQAYAVGFYTRMGFAAEGEPFLDADIEHRKMVRSLA